MVRLTDHPDMTLDVYRGRKTTIQQQLAAFADCRVSGDCVSNLLTIRVHCFANCLIHAVMRIGTSSREINLPFECFASLSHLVSSLKGKSLLLHQELRVNNI